MIVNKGWNDVETTGFDPIKQSIVELAFAIEIDGEIIPDFYHEYMQPYDYNTVSQSACDIHGISIDTMRTFQSPKIAFVKFLEFLNRNKLEGKTIALAGHNANFDKSFIYQWFIKEGKRDLFFKYFDTYTHCTLSIARDMFTKKQVKNHKLGTMCEFAGIPLEKAHNALYDIGATIKLDTWMREYKEANKKGLQTEAKAIKEVEVAADHDFIGDRSYIMFNAEGSIYIHDKLIKNRPAYVKVLKELLRRVS